MFQHKKNHFSLPENLVYLDGNSLGPLPLAVQQRVNQTITNEWGEMLIAGWNKAGWFDAPMLLGNKIARLIGAQQDSVCVGDTLSLKVYQALGAALSLAPASRKVVLTDSGNFPTDIYMAQALLELMGQGYQLKIVAPEAVESAMDENTAVLMLTHVDYQTGRMHDMAALSARAKELGILTFWDLAHSAGAVDLNLAACGVDFAAGCTYKYLNAGPGAPAFVYVHPKHSQTAKPVLPGWLGHARPFSFELDYSPAPWASRFRIGTPAILQCAALEAALGLWDDVDMKQLRAKSLELTAYFIASVEQSCPELELITPRQAEQRGSQVSFAFDHAYSAIQALIDMGVVGDFRAPRTMRFGFAPLYNSKDDCIFAAEALAKVMTDKLWQNPAYQKRNAVT